MEAIYKWLSEAWLAVDGKLSFIKPTPLRIAVVVFAALTAIQVLSYILPLAVGFVIVAVGVILLFKMLHDIEDDDSKTP